MTGWRAWLLAARPPTLPAAIVPVWVGLALVLEMDGRVDWLLGLFTAASALAIQVATNFFNDAVDYSKGADTGKRLGPQRMTASGVFSARQVMMMGVGMLVLACVFAVPLVLAAGWPVVVIGLVAMYLSYGYTGGPFPLAYRGLGEVFALVFFGLIAVAGTVFVQIGHWTPESFLLGAQVGAYATVLLAVNNLRDVEEDRQSGKRTLAVRLGENFARAEILFLNASPAILAVIWIFFGRLHLMIPSLLVLPLGLMLSLLVWYRRPGREYNRFLVFGGLQMLLFAVLFQLLVL